MHDSICVKQLFSKHAQSLKLQWIAGVTEAPPIFCREPDASTSLVGYLNFVHPQQIIVLGPQEFAYLAKLDVNSYHHAIEQLLKARPKVIIATDKQQVPSELVESANQYGVPLMQSGCQGQTVIDHLLHFLSTKLACTLNVHGVFMEVFDLGILLKGTSGIGKSELALELINRNHRLIADDSTTLAKFAPDALTGMCPPILQDFLEVRGLGVLDIRALFGSTAIKNQKQLHLIINILDSADISNANRLHALHQNCEILAVNIPEVSIPIMPGRSLAVLVETAVRNQVLKMNGYDAALRFEKRQQKELELSRTD